MRQQRTLPLLAYALFIIPLGIFFLPARQESTTFDKDIRPIIGKYCLPCHLADSENPSGLAMDNFDMMRKGGENGDPIVPGQPEESLMYLKLKDPPPFGKKMPRNRKSLPEDDLQTIRRWIEQGAKEK